MVNRQGAELRILAVIPPEKRREIARQLAPLKADVLFLGHSSEAAAAIEEDDVFQVALLPASLSDTGCWELWGLLAFLDPRPALLVYAREASFQLWSRVLESGGFDVILEPFSDEELQDAVRRAAKSFSERSSNGPVED
jgi:DNA-binding NtrC family response regulator